MIVLEPRVYRLILNFDTLKPWNVLDLCKNLGIMAEQQEPIHEDEWGIRGVLELWFQKVDENSITLHIQKKHSSRKKTYLKDLEELFYDLGNIDYIKNYHEIG